MGISILLTMEMNYLSNKIFLEQLTVVYSIKK